MAASLSGTNLVPLCTSSEGSDDRGLRLHDAGVDILHGAKISSRKVALVGVLYVPEEEKDATSAERGLFLSSSAVSVPEQDASMLLLVLRGVSLVDEPFWGSLLLVLSLHVVVAKTGPISSSSFQAALPFLSTFTQLQVGETVVDADRNVALLKELVPRFTWGAIDLKIKDMNGCDSASTYFEQQLASGSTDAQLLLSALVPTRDCVVLKSNSFQGPEDPHTSPKLLTHVADRLECKSFFGRYLNGSLLARLIRSLTHAMAAPDGVPVVLQRVVTNVLAAHWQQLVQRAFKSYCDLMHARLAVYERAPITAEYLVDVTERKLKANQSQSNQHSAVVDAGQGDYSVFDEFGNLKKQQVSDREGGGSAITSNTQAPLNTGLFSFLKNRAGRALSKQLSRFPTNRWSTSIRSGGQTTSQGENGELGGILEDAEAAEADLHQENTSQTPDYLLARCTAPITRYTVPMEYLNTPSEAMPVNTAVLDIVHAEGLEEVNALLKPFLVDLRGPPPSWPELVCSLDFHVGKKKLWAKLGRVRRRFERANEVSSAIFCGELLRYLHSVVLSKNETDTEAQQQQQLRGRAVSSIMLVDKKSGNAPVALTRVPLELLTYKNNLEAMVSQYNFVARGPQAATALAGFLNGPVRSQLLYLTQQEYDRFSAACDEKEHRIAELEDSLDDKESQVKHITKANAEWGRQESEAVAQIEQTHAEQVSSLQGAIRSTETQIASALAEQQALYQSTMQATRRTIDTVDKVADKGRVVSGYLERYEKGHVFSSRWRQYFYVLKHATLTCYKSKSGYEERGPPFERPISISGYSVVRSRTDELKIKLIPPEAGHQKLRFRAPASVGRETWMKRFTEAAQYTSQ
ncbi:PH domain-containing protein [Phytophthora infestans]|uniref:PH domain-containing protein n=1 Tax=Phytophthora infestans TaxID=4787 RepID=A0A8S9UCG0_PHYIN|nr:PH domain-containing protein [Phytophthora infestans]